ncbi:hypothetical protein QYE76_062299, partial [Lolium multiflorum]
NQSVELYDEWGEKTEQFVDRAFAIPSRPISVWCPCSKCANRKAQDKETMSMHLIKFGFTSSYRIWTYHGEKAKKRARKEVQQIQPRGKYDTGFDRCLENLANVPESSHVEVETPQDAETSEDPEENTKEYYEALFASQKPLHENTEVTQLDAIARLMALKCHRNLCRDGFDELLVIVGSLLPKGHLLPQNFYYSTKLLSDLKMSSQQIHACPKGCMLFREEHADTNYCIKCNSSRYFEVDRNGDGQKRQTTVAKNILRYLPVLPRIQRLFMTEDTAQQMRWAVEGNRYTDKMIHPSDGTAWKNFVKKFPLKAGDPRSVAVAISTDGFNPYGMSAAVYSCWPVFVIPMNLPPGVCMRSENMFVSMIIPGPKYPGKNMNVYLEPLVDDLVRGWEGRGIRTYDASKKKYFDMYVWYHTSLHDLPARALFCGWCTHGKWPCPQCRQAVTFFWLNKGGKYSCFDEARQFLERRHAYRSDVKSFKKGRVVRGPKPIPTGTEIKAELDALQPSPDGNGFLGYGETHQWTHKPCLWKLPYFEFLELPHNIDVMHTEKNISEAIWSTIVDTEKTKDNIKARIDQESSFQYEDPSQRPPRGYSNILGGILRWYFPGIVNLPTGGCDVAWRWAHYSLAEDPLGRGTAADLVVAKFWRYFKRAEGKENACDDVLHQLARKRVTGMHYEARIQCVRDWHADRFVHMTKEDACDTLMQPWQYLQNPPQYVGNDDRCFLAMVMWWTCPQYLKKHEEGKKKRAEMRGGSHIQGSIPISLHLQKEEVRTGAKPNVFAVLKKMKQRKTPETGSVWVNPQSETQCTSYVSKFKQKYGEDANPEARTLTLSEVPSLRQIRRGRKSGQPEVEPRPRASDLAVERLREEMAAKERPRAKGADGAADCSSGRHDDAQMQQQQMMQQQQARMSWLMSRRFDFSTGESSCSTLLAVDAATATQTPGTPITVNNMNIIRSMNREIARTAKVPAHGKERAHGKGAAARQRGERTAKAFAVRYGQAHGNVFVAVEIVAVEIVAVQTLPFTEKVFSVRCNFYMFLDQ